MNCKKFFAVVLLLLPIFVHAQTTLVNINTADSAELQTLNGIGVSKAQAIIDYRNTNGPFQTIEDITKVSGIPLGGATFNNIKDYITVGDVSAPISTSGNNQATTTTTQSTTSPNAGGSGSTHSSYTDISNFNYPENFQISAGRDRLVTVGFPVDFKAEANGYDGNASYVWSFGDGASGVGKYISHAYEYAGDYVVMLNASSPNGLAVSRTNVTVREPKLSLAEVNPDFISIKNNALEEINLYGWHIKVGDKTFTFPRDTIVSAGKVVRFPADVTNLEPKTTRDVALGTYNTGNILRVEKSGHSVDVVKVNELYTKALELGEQLTAMRRARPLVAVPSNVQYTASALGSLISTNATTTNATSTEIGWLTKFKRFLLGN